MLWFKSDITAAVAQAKESQSNLIIFTTNGDEFSMLYQSTLENLKELDNKAYLAITIEAYSIPYEQLKAIYRVVPVPSILVIDFDTGVAVERIAGPDIDEDTIKEFLDALPEKRSQEDLKINVDKVTEKPLVRGSKKKEEIAPTPTEQNNATDANPQNSSQTAAVKDAHARIQFKLPAGQCEVHVFEATDTLAEVRKQAVILLKLKGGFDLAVPYPRRPLPAELDGHTVEALSLCPASTLLVLPHESGSLVPWMLLNRIASYFEPIFTTLQAWWHRLTQQVVPPNRPPRSDAKLKRN